MQEPQHDISLSLRKQLRGSSGEFCLDVKLELNFGECVALFGKSGAGKSTILRLLSGLDEADPQSRICVGGAVWLDTKDNISLPPQRRKTGFVFQNHALFPHLNVYENVLFGARGREDRICADELLSLMELESLKHARIAHLSGGQAQRVALARALVYRPDILLLDEPFSALDSTMSRALQGLIKSLHQRYKLTIILVSHNIADLFALAQRGFILERGRIVRLGSIEELFTQSLDSERSESSGIPLPGVIVDKRRVGDMWHFSVLCHNQILHLKVSNTPSPAHNGISVDSEVGQSVLIYTCPMI